MMIRAFNFLRFLVGVFLYLVPCSYGESSTCLMVYKEGGAPAVFQSPKCPRWTLSTDAVRRRTENCQSAMLQGRRKYQEDRIVCALDVRIPFPGSAGTKEVTVGIVGVFDGHNGAEASEMASKLLLEYFFLHIYFLLDGIYSVALKKPTGRLPYKGEAGLDFQVLNWDERQNQRDLGAGSDGSFHMEILKESLLRAIHDIDEKFSKEALRYNRDSGSTATVVLKVDGQILVANVGDSKALLCSEKLQSSQEARGNLSKFYRRKRQNGAIIPINDNEKFRLAASNGLVHFFVKELTRDHHPDRDDERSRVEAAGGYVVDRGGIFRVNGELAVSRAIGDVPFKSYGVIPTPEVTDWLPLTSNDSYLVIASDGIFEKLTTQDICDLLWDADKQIHVHSELVSSCMHSLADCIVNTAFERGSMDNMAAIVVPLRPTAFSRTLIKDSYDRERSIETSTFELQKLIESTDFKLSGLVSMEYAHQTMGNFKRLLVEGKHGRLGCFYLSENLNENMDYAFRIQKDDQKDDMYNLHQTLPQALGHQHGGPLNFYNDQSLCLHFGMDIEEEYVYNVESYMYLNLGSQSNSSGHHDYHDGPCDDSSFILKRIMKIDASYWYNLSRPNLAQLNWAGLGILAFGLGMGLKIQADSAQIGLRLNH
ncbi:PREDICTED: probable protein phosphatase 2C 51 [Nelumbo nucifera]|uniref:Probable protein phosphatase 2C 51 n=1 Tax=Nelumbo nucifera TaxID=4432 RepID=A0A1U7ZVM9_NELNU|nr:PREDICTED: probable protein phosphatase 2C 51 [Nelumbo nucifera]